MPIHIEYGRCIRFKSWDGFMLPLPFSKVEVTFAKPESIPSDFTLDQFEEARQRVERIMKPVTH